MMLVVRVDGVLHEIFTVVLIDGRTRDSAPMDPDGNTARVALACRSDRLLLVDPRMIVIKPNEVCDEPRIDCMTCMVRSARA